MPALRADARLIGVTGYRPDRPRLASPSGCWPVLHGVLSVVHGAAFVECR